MSYAYHLWLIFLWRLWSQNQELFEIPKCPMFTNSNVYSIEKGTPIVWSENTLLSLTFISLAHSKNSFARWLVNYTYIRIHTWPEILLLYTMRKVASTIKKIKQSHAHFVYDYVICICRVQSSHIFISWLFKESSLKAWEMETHQIHIIYGSNKMTWRPFSRLTPARKPDNIILWILYDHSPDYSVWSSPLQGSYWSYATVFHMDGGWVVLV